MLDKKLALRVQTNQILTNDDKDCIPRLSSILLAVLKSQKMLANIDFN